MSDSSATPRPATLCVHSGTHLDSATGGVSSPVFTASAYAHPSPSGENIYPRYFNVPNQRVVARKVADLEGGEDALVFASGMGAIATVLLALLKPGDHAVFQADLYGGTHHLIRHGLQTRGIEVDFARGLDEFRNAMRATTRVVYVESPSNPLLRCVDLAAVASLAKSKGAVSVIDNTFATPINQRPISLGFDVVVHSATKYLNGHSDLNAGVAVASASLISMFRESAMDLGASLDPRVCYLLERGLKTLVSTTRTRWLSPRFSNDAPKWRRSTTPASPVIRSTPSPRRR
jgi:cystathionine beta-lyase/cystathionine gamma-synthase